MNKLAPVILAAILAVVAACSGGSTPGSPLTCDTVVDAVDGQTAAQVITDLYAMMITDSAANVAVGAGTNDTQLIQAAAQALAGYSGSQFASDAAQFAGDGQDHAPAGTLADDITDLAGDCSVQQAAEQLVGLQPYPAPS